MVSDFCMLLVCWICAYNVGSLQGYSPPQPLSSTQRLAPSKIIMNTLSGRPNLPPPSTTTTTPHSNTVTPRKKHINKYAQQSKKAVDPLTQAIIATKLAEEEQIKKSNRVIRGTTMPTIQGSDNVTSPSVNSGTNMSSNRVDRSENPRKGIDLSRVCPSDPYTFGYVEIGRILTPHGVKGELKIQFDSSDFADFRVRNSSVLYIKKPNRRAPRAVKVVYGKKQMDNVYIVAFEGIYTRLAAASLRLYSVYVRTEDRPQLQQEEYLIRDIVGSKCYFPQQLHSSCFEKEIDFATVEGIVPPDELCDPSVAKFMHSMLEIRKRGTRDFCLIPFVPSIVVEVDIQNKRVFIDPPEGLLDLSYEVVEKFVVKGYLPAKIEWLSATQREWLLKNAILTYPAGGVRVQAT